MSASRAATRVLVVEDEGSLLMTLVANLELEGFEVLEASSGAEALSLLAGQRVDLVLTDIRMPGMTGVELFRRIRELDQRLPVVLMTAFANEALVDQAIGQGAFALLPKPFAIEHVVATLSSAARRPVVMVVDAAAEQARRLARELAEGGVAARAAHDEASALGLLRDRTVDVCVMELAPDDARGPALAARLLAAEPSLVLVTVSPVGAPDLAARIAALGGFAWLAKPYDRAELVRVIAKARGRSPVVPGRHAASEPSAP